MAALEFVQPPPLSERTPWVIWPAGLRRTKEEFIAALDSLSEPTVASFHAESRAMTLLSLSQADQGALPSLRHAYENQSEHLKAKLKLLGHENPSTPVLLYLPDNEIVSSIAEVAQWVREIILTSVGWTLELTDDDPRAPIQLFLMRPDRTWSPGFKGHGHPPVTRM